MRLLTNRPDVADDLAQDAFVRVYRHAQSAGRPIDNPGGLLRTTTVNVCRSWHTSQQRLQQRMARHGADSVSLTDSERELDDSLRRLPYDQRAVVVLRYWLGLTEAEIAESLDCRPGTVKSRLATILVVGLVAVEGRDDPHTPAASPAANASDPATTVPSKVIDTTIVVDSPELIPVGAVICIDAGAGQRATNLCTQELGGLAIAGTATSNSSFVMPVDPAKPADVAGTANAAAVLNLPVADFDAGLLPPSLVAPAHATTYLVLGTSNPYTS